jgi:hypothetical protein
MKTTDSKSVAVATQRAPPFFSKEEGPSFFGSSGKEQPGKEQPFFTRGGHGPAGIQAKCASCEQKEKSGKKESGVPGESSSGKPGQAKQGIDELMKMEFTCPPVGVPFGTISGMGGSGTLGVTTIDRSSKLSCAPRFVVDPKTKTGTFSPVQTNLIQNSKFPNPVNEAASADKLPNPKCNKDVPVFYTITPQISTLIQQGEQEHCDDVTRAFNLTLVPCTTEVNKFAGQKLPGQTEDECYKALVAKLGFDPIDCTLEFTRLAGKTGDRDTQGFHDFDPVVISQDCTKIVAGNKKSATNKIGDASVAPAVFIPASTKCAKAQPTP